MSIEEKIKRALGEARKILRDEKEPDRAAVFPVVLEALLRAEKEPMIVSPVGTEKKELGGGAGLKSNDVLVELATATGISLEELKNVIDFENEKFIFLAEIDGSVAEKQTKASQCLLTAWIKGAGVEWISASLITDAISELRYGSTENLARDIRRRREIFRVKGERRDTKYSLTIKGWKDGIALLKELAQLVS